MVFREPLQFHSFLQHHIMTMGVYIFSHPKRGVKVREGPSRCTCVNENLAFLQLSLLLLFITSFTFFANPLNIQYAVVDVTLHLSHNCNLLEAHDRALKLEPQVGTLRNFDGPFTNNVIDGEVLSSKPLACVSS